VSEYQLLGADEVRAARYVEDNLPADAVFLTGNQHNNAIAALTGRHIVCGTGSYLFFHGIDYSAQADDERRMLEDPAGSAGLFARYGVTHAYISSHERAAFAVDEVWFAQHAEKVFESGDVAVYALAGSGKTGLE